MLTHRWLAAGAAAVLTLTLGAAPGTAGAARRAPGADCPPGQAHCDVWDNDDGDAGDGGGTTDPGDGGGSGGGDRVCRTDSGVVKPCYDDVLGWFNSTDDCYYKVMEPQPENVEPGTVAYLRSCVGPASSDPVFLDAAPPGFDPPDPAEMALDLLATLPLAKPVIRTAPSGEPGLVGVPVWLYDASNWEPAEASASEGDVTVEIEATPVRIVWAMGNGAEVECTGKGVPFKAGVHDPRDPPGAACVYRGYPRSSRSQEGGSYLITATKYWRVPWTSSTGASGTLPAEAESDEEIEIDELQVVTQ